MSQDAQASDATGAIPSASDPAESGPTGARILIVDDEKMIREILAEFLTLEGYNVRTVEDGSAALTELRMRPYDMLITDLKMPKISGLELLEKVTEQKLGVLTVMMTGYGTVETAIEAMKKGAYDYILKPFKVEEVIHVVQRGLHRQQLQAENIRLREALTIYKVSEAISVSRDINHILAVILDAAIDEVDADIATLWLRNPTTDVFEEELRKTTARRHVATTKGIPSVALNPLLAQFAQGRPVLQHGSKIGQFVSDASAFADMHSFLSVPLQSGGTVFGILNVISMTRGKAFNEGHRKMLSVLASRAATAIESVRLYCDLERTNSHLRRANLSLEENFQQTVAGFAQALEESDLYTRGHSERVATYAELIGRGLTLTETEVRDIVQSGLMHDIGKIGIRYDMLNKPGKLSPDEVKVFRTHPEKGKRILDSVPCLHGLIDGCWCHHERFDGDGYPRGLRGHDIPLLGRIVAIADAYDAMTTDRAYRRALSHEIAIGEMERCAGSQFDPEITELFLHAIERYRTEMIARGQTSELPR
ncbi:MAG: response regulator [Myxococcales bacterium]|nr:response regulator [Myxococcales bacterium]